MTGGKKKREFTKPTVPAYLVSFGDMMTILLTFFILLCTYASTKSSGFIYDGIGSFRSAIEGMGLPGFLPSDRLPISLGDDKIKYESKKREENGERDQDERRLTDEIEVLKRGKVDRLDLGQQVQMELPIRFASGTADIVDGQEDTLRGISGLVVANGRCVEIIGHADREHLPPLDRSRLAIRRASRIVEILRREYGAPASGLAAGAAAGSRADTTGSLPTGDITLRVFRSEQLR